MGKQTERNTSTPPIHDDLGFTLSPDVQAEMLRHGQLDPAARAGLQKTQGISSDHTHTAAHGSSREALKRMQAYADGQMANGERRRAELQEPLQRLLRLAYELSVPSGKRNAEAISAFPASPRGQELQRLYSAIVKASFGYEFLLQPDGPEGIKPNLMRITPALEAVRRCEFENALRDLDMAGMYIEAEALRQPPGVYETEAKMLLPEIQKRAARLRDIFNEVLGEKDSGQSYPVSPALRGLAASLREK